MYIILKHKSKLEKKTNIVERSCHLGAETEYVADWAGN